MVDVRLEWRRVADGTRFDERLVRRNEGLVDALDVGFFGVVQFRSACTEELQSVVGEGVVRCGDDRGGRTRVLREKGDGGSRRHADEVDGDAFDTEALGDGVGQYGARFTRVVADDDP